MRFCSLVKTFVSPGRNRNKRSYGNRLQRVFVEQGRYYYDTYCIQIGDYGAKIGYRTRTPTFANQIIEQTYILCMTSMLALKLNQHKK